MLLDFLSGVYSSRQGSSVFEARQQFDDTVRELARVHKRQEFLAELDTAYDDLNLFEGYCKAQSAILEYKQLANNSERSLRV